MLKAAGFRSPRLGSTRGSRALGMTILMILITATLSAYDLSKYRDFQLGTNLATVARQAGESPSDARVIHERPALIQELRWRPLSLDPSTDSDSVKQVVFHFYQGTLFQIVVDYDRYETAGLTTGDLVEALSATYGIATRPPAPAEPASASYGELGDAVALWQDAEHSFELSRSEYGPTYTLIGVLKRLAAPARSAILEAARLDVQDAPKREAEKAERDAQQAIDKDENDRLLNKPKFRP